MKKSFVTVCMILTYHAYSQNVIDVNKGTVPLSNRVFYTAGGQPFSTTKYVAVVAGSPYFKDNWMKGAIAVDTVEYSNMRLKMDLIENAIIYLNEQGQEMVSVASIDQISLRDSITGASYLFTHLPKEDKKWFQVLSAGKLSLYKLHHKYMLESKAYGSSVTEQTIKTEERYYAMFNDSPTRIKKPKDMVELVAVKHSRQLADYIDKQKLNGKKESDFVAAVEYYNSLQ